MTVSRIFVLRGLFTWKFRFNVLLFPSITSVTQRSKMNAAWETETEFSDTSILQAVFPFALSVLLLLLLKNEILKFVDSIFINCVRWVRASFISMCKFAALNSSFSCLGEGEGGGGVLAKTDLFLISAPKIRILSLAL